MNKKIISIVLFIFIFASGIFTMAKPVRGYKFGVPEIAKGQEGESRVILYDEDEWDNHLGVGADNPDDFFGEYADVVGAKSKGKLLDWWEDDEINFFGDYILTIDVDIESIPEITDFNSVFDYICDATHGLGDPESGYGAVVALYEGVTTPPLDWSALDFSKPENKIKGYVVRNGSIAVNYCNNYGTNI